MDWINFIILWLPLSVIALVFLRLLFLEFRTGDLKDLTAKRSLITVIFVLLAQIAGKTLWFYFELQKSDFGKYFLEGSNSYFRRTVWYMIQPEVWAFAVAIGFLIVLWLIRKILKSPMFNKADTMIIIMTVLAVGSSSVLVLLVGSLILMLLVHLGLGIYRKNFKGMRLRFSPFLIFLALAIIVLNNFDFYQEFLGLLRLQ